MKQIQFLTFYLILINVWSAQGQQQSINYLNKQLDNGLQLLIIEDEAKPVVTMNVVVKEGPMYLNEKEIGLHLLSSLMFIGATERYPAAELSYNKLRKINAQYNRSIYESAQTYTIKCYKNHTDTVFGLISEWIQHPVLTNEELALAKFRADSTIKADNQQTAYLLNERRIKLFEKYGLKQLDFASMMTNITACNREQLVEYRSKFYRPQNILLIIHGKVNKFDVIAKLNRLMGKWTLPELNTPEINVQIRLPLSTQSLIGTPSAQYPALQFCFPGPSYKANTVDYYAGKVLSTLLNNSSHSFKKSLDKNLSYYEFETESFNIINQSFLTFTCISPPDQLRKIYDTMNVVLNKLSTHVKDDLQLNQAKRRTYQLYEYKSANTSEYLNLLGVHWANDLLNEYYNAQSIINKLTAADLQSFITRYLEDKPSARFLLISPAHQTSTNSRTFFNDFESYADLTIYYDFNSETFSTAGENSFYKAAQFLKINKQIGAELTIYQDVGERKDLVKKRYVNLYLHLYGEGISEKELDEMNVNLYVSTTQNALETDQNQRAFFSKPKQ